MELYLDSVDFKEIEAALAFGFVKGLTTTPTFMHRHGITDIDGAIVKLSGMVPELDRNVDALANDGQLIVIGMQGGTKGELNLGKLMAKRARVVGTALRSRPVRGPGSKSAIVEEVVANVWPLIADSSVRPVIGAEFPIQQARAAHQLLASGEVSGKVLLRVAD